MNKDIIYIDVDDDITAIIGKVKAAKNKVVALVPPKRTGVLQSAVNLRLLARAAQQSNKHLVLISGNSALGALAAAANIPVARNLQSKPEVAPTPEQDEDEGEDVIDGADLPIGDHARTADDAAAAAGALASPAVDEAIRDDAAEETPRTIPSLPSRQARRPSGRSVGAKIPNFDTFRKRLALGVGGGLLLIALLVWATFFAPHAKIVITARTLGTSVNSKVTLDPSGKTDMTAGTLKAVRQQIKKDASLTFDATGSKTVGDKAKGTVVFQNCESPNSITVPAGTGVSASGMTYITQSDATVPGGQGNFSGCTTPGKSDPVAIVAQDIGDEYNADAGTRFSVAGHSNSSTASYFRGVADSDITGGSKKTITVVSQADLQKATDQLAGQSNDAVKKQLASKFSSSSIAIDQTFNVDQGGVKSSPAVDEEVTDGKAKLTGSLVFTMLGVEKSEVGHFLDAYFAKQIGNKNDQRVYDNGADKASFVDVASANNTYTGTLVATGKLGPKIDDNAVKAQARGKRYGDVQASLGQIAGVENVDIKFSPFWVSTVPNDDKRISIDFKLDESK